MWRVGALTTVALWSRFVGGVKHVFEGYVGQLACEDQHAFSILTQKLAATQGSH